MEISEPVKHVPMQMKEAQVAPGQLITHYAPYCDTFLVQLKDTADLPEIVKANIKNTVILDFDNILHAYSPYCLKTINLSESQLILQLIIRRGSVTEAMRNIYSVLREAESIENVKLILLPDLSYLHDEMAPSVMDRIIRATSGRLIELPSLPVFQFSVAL